MKTSILSVAVLALSLGGCASLTAVEKSGLGPKGIPIFAPKALVVVNAEGTNSLIVPDCSKEYRIQMSSFLAKHHAVIAIENGMLKSVDSDQDSTALPLALVQLVKEAALAKTPIGNAFSSKADGGVADRFGIYELNCDSGKLTIEKSAISSTLDKIPTTRAIQGTTVGGIGQPGTSVTPTLGSDLPDPSKK